MQSGVITHVNQLGRKAKQMGGIALIFGAKVVVIL